MYHVSFAKIDEVFSFKKKLEKREKSCWKSQGILSVRQSGNHEKVEGLMKLNPIA